MHILLVRQVLEIRLGVDMLSRGLVHGLAPLVLVEAVQRIENDDDHGERVGREDGAQAERVQGRLVGLEELGRDDVADTVGLVSDISSPLHTS